MALESLTGSTVFIDDLVATNPVGAADPVSDLDGHIQGIKNVLQNSFPGVTGAVTATHTELNLLDGITTAAVGVDDTQTLTNKTLTDPVINTSSFSASLDAAQAISATTYTKITWDTEDWDTNSDYDSVTNHRFTPTVAGKYLITLQGVMGGVWTDTSQSWGLYIYKNGTSIRENINNIAKTTGNESRMVTAIVDANGTTDYFEAYVYHSDTTRGSTNFSGTGLAERCYFQGQWIGS